MRVVVTLIDMGKETRIEGDSPFMSGESGDKLEQRKLGFWLNDWRFAEGMGIHHKSRVFCPWSSVLFIEQKVNHAEGQEAHRRWNKDSVG